MLTMVLHYRNLAVLWMLTMVLHHRNLAVGWMLTMVLHYRNLAAVWLLTYIRGTWLLYKCWRWFYIRLGCWIRLGFTLGLAWMLTMIKTCNYRSVVCFSLAAGWQPGVQRVWLRHRASRDLGVWCNGLLQRLQQHTLPRTISRYCISCLCGCLTVGSYRSPLASFAKRSQWIKTNRAVETPPCIDAWAMPCLALADWV